MKVVVMSDNHGMRMALIKVFDHYQDEKDIVFVHCGDSEFPYQDSVFEDCYRVTGNCDNDSQYPGALTFEVGGISFFLTHGHLQWVNAGVDRLAVQAKEQGAKVALYGHTHKLYEETKEGVLCLNSGSVAYPRGQFVTTPTYMVITIKSAKEINVTYYQMNHQPLEGFSYHYHDEEGRGFVHD